jgi:DNA-binding NarL/FixJ family response regulator
MTQDFRIVILDDDREDKMEAWRTRLIEEVPLQHKPEILNKAIYFIERPRHRIDTDLVLLDVEGMATTENVIRAIHRKWPRLPIVILSKFNDLGPALKYLDAGASWYLYKKQVPPHRPSQYGKARNNEGWDNAVRIITKLISEYRIVKQELYGGRVIGRVVKKSKPHDLEALEKLARQYEFLRMIERMENSSLPRIFPVDTVRKLDTDSYEIPFYRARSLRETLFELHDENEIIQTAVAVLPNILKGLKTELFDKTPPQPVGDKPRWFEEFYLTKLNERLQQTITEAAKTADAVRE